MEEVLLQELTKQDKQRILQHIHLPFKFHNMANGTTFSCKGCNDYVRLDERYDEDVIMLFIAKELIKIQKSEGVKHE